MAIRVLAAATYIVIAQLSTGPSSPASSGTYARSACTVTANLSVMVRSASPSGVPFRLVAGHTGPIRGPGAASVDGGMGYVMAPEKLGSPS
jgi:hypothetical protein